MKRKITISIDEEIYGLIKDLAGKQGIGVSTLIESVLRGGLDSTNELVEALGGLSINRLLAILTTEGRRVKAKKKK